MRLTKLLLYGWLGFLFAYLAYDPSVEPLIAIIIYAGFLLLVYEERSRATD